MALGDRLKGIVTLFLDEACHEMVLHRLDEKLVEASRGASLEEGR